MKSLCISFCAFVICSGLTAIAQDRSTNSRGASSITEKKINFAEKDISQIASSDPAVDLRDAIARRDFRFIGIMGYTLDVPGVHSDDDLILKAGIKVIKGTSDADKDKRNGELQEMARSYATRYNRYLWKYLNQQKS